MARVMHCQVLLVAKGFCYYVLHMSDVFSFLSVCRSKTKHILVNSPMNHACNVSAELTKQWELFMTQKCV